MNHLFKFLFALSILAVGLSSCSDDQSYTDLLNKESKNVNLFLSDHKVIGSIPADTVFQTGPDAPFYMIDDEGKIFMQVIDAGSGPKATTNQLVYFRYTRYNLSYYKSDGELPLYDSNENAAYPGTYFRFGDYQLGSSTEWGTGIQEPLRFLPLNCRVNLLVKAEYGWTAELSEVQPMLIKIRYYPSRL